MGITLFYLSEIIVFVLIIFLWLQLRKYFKSKPWWKFLSSVIIVGSTFNFITSLIVFANNQ